ncbi:hypothetical protein QFC20_007261 [Naganishia adeliensis]|uniref:Uncharacterized protein n=1 Tax=Naganishia adeliensis TaxID=92952 RepID=A0ACC2V168_9TREE|nr:hypothetical protein QFC20_007261 [Naganishia adeliensis]
MTTCPALAGLMEFSELWKGLCARILLPQTISSDEAKLTPEEEALLEKWLGYYKDGVKGMIEYLAHKDTIALPGAIVEMRKERVKEGTLACENLQVVLSKEHSVESFKKALMKFMDSFFRLRGIVEQEEKARSEHIAEDVGSGASMWADESLGGEGENMDIVAQGNFLTMLGRLELDLESQERLLLAAGFPGSDMKSVKEALRDGSQLNSVYKDWEDMWGRLKAKPESGESGNTGTEATSAMAFSITIAHILHQISRTAFPIIESPICDCLAPLYFSTISNTKNMRSGSRLQSRCRLKRYVYFGWRTEKDRE